MSDPLVHPTTAASPNAAPAKHAPPFSFSRSWKVGSVVAAVMVLLALLGVGLTTSNRSIASTYWMSLVPVYGLLCVGTAWVRARHEGGLPWAAVLRQVLHWLGIAGALALDFAIRETGEEAGRSAGLNALLLLALGCYLAGIHLEWHFAIVGILLTLAPVLLAKAEQYMWLFFVIGIAAAAALLGWRWLLAKVRARKSPGSLARA